MLCISTSSQGAFRSNWFLHPLTPRWLPPPCPFSQMSCHVVGFFHDMEKMNPFPQKSYYYSDTQWQLSDTFVTFCNFTLQVYWGQVSFIFVQSWSICCFLMKAKLVWFGNFERKSWHFLPLFILTQKYKQQSFDILFHSMGKLMVKQTDV